MAKYWTIEVFGYLIAVNPFLAFLTITFFSITLKFLLMKLLAQSGGILDALHVHDAVARPFIVQPVDIALVPCAKLIEMQFKLNAGPSDSFGNSLPMLVHIGVALLFLCMFVAVIAFGALSIVNRENNLKVAIRFLGCGYFFASVLWFTFICLWYGRVNSP